MSIYESMAILAWIILCIGGFVVGAIYLLGRAVGAGFRAGGDRWNQGRIEAEKRNDRFDR